MCSTGIYDLYIDIPQQKLTIIGWADPEKILKAIKKTRKIATICSHTEPTEPPPAQAPEQAPDGGAPAPDAANPPPAEAPPTEAAPPAEPPKDPPPPPPENPPQQTTAPLMAPEANTSQPAPNPSGQKDGGEVHVIYHHPPEYGYRYGYGHGHGGHRHTQHINGQGLQQEPPQPISVTHSYNTYKPSPYVTEYEYVRSPPSVAGYEYVRSPPRHTYNSRMDRYSEDYRNGNNPNGNITSMFSDENPNACRIM